MMLPTLVLLQDGQPHSMKEISENLAQQFNVSEAERLEKLPSGRVAKWTNRLAWVASHFNFAQIISRPARGQIQITQRGQDVLKQKPPRVDLKLLRSLPGYEDARDGGPERKEATVSPEEQKASPLEVLETSAAELRRALAAELLETIKSRSPRFFEDLVLELMLKLGYGSFTHDAAEHLGKGGDRGLDGLIREDKLGLDMIYLQAKRWDGAVGPATVREFLGALDQAGAKKGVLITTSSFTKEARLPSSKSDKKISLIDGMMLAELMIEHDLGVTTVRNFQIKKIDSDYFEED